MIGIIGAMESEVSGLISLLDGRKKETHGGIEFNTGVILGTEVVIAKCGVGKVFSAMCAEAMIISYSPSLIINTGVGGALDPSLNTGDIVVSDSLCQHDLDTSPLGDPRGLVSGINKIYFEADKKTVERLLSLGEELNIPVKSGRIASGDLFVADPEIGARIRSEFGADVCEMEGCAIAQAAYVSDIPFVVVRAISDGANSDSGMDFPTFLALAAERSTALTLALISSLAP